MMGRCLSLLDKGWRLLRRTDVFLGLLCLALCLLVVQRYGGGAGEGEILGNAPVAEAAVGRLDDAAEEPARPPLDLPRQGRPVRFLMYNVESYFVPGEKSRSRYVNKPKAPAAREAVAAAIASARPEILGLMEIGGPRALADLRERLEKMGLSYPYEVLVLRPGEDRALALLSRHPVVCDRSRAQYGLFGQQKRQMLRGILDVTVDVGDGRVFRLVGVHLKSRVAEDAESAESLRKREAQTVARYLQGSMAKQPDMPVLLFGDWNDGPGDESVQVLRQGITPQSAMVRLKPQDSRGEYWTIFHRASQQYYTFDQVYVNRILRQRVGRHAACGIVDADGVVAQASDHRPVWVDLR